MSEKCSPDDPRRCQGVTPHGQCEYLAVEGSKFCNYHSNGAAPVKAERKKTERYMIDNQSLRSSYLRQQDDAEYLNLRDEILLATAVLERRLNTLKTDSDVIMAVGPVSQLLQRLESMKISLLKLQTQLGLVIGKDELRSLAQEIATILDEELEGIEDKDDRLDRIAERLFVAIEAAGRKDTDD